MASIRRTIGLTGWRLWLALVVGLYALAGFVGVPWAIRSQLPPKVAETTGAELTLQDVSFNPFTLALTIWNADLTDPELGHLVSIESLRVDAAWASVARRALVLSDVQLVEPRLSARRNADGRFNAQILMDRMPESPEPESDEPAEIPRFVLEHFLLDEGRMLLTDATVRPEFVEPFGPATLELNDFSTLPDDDGDLRFQVASEEGGQYEWQGRVGVNPLASTGRLDVRNESLVELWEYFEGRVPWRVETGRMGLGFDYRFAMDDQGPIVTVENGTASVSDLLVTAGEEIMNFPAVTVEGIGADVRASKVDVGAVRVTGGRIATWLEPDGSLNLVRIFAPPAGGGQREDPPEPPALGDAPAGPATSLASEEASPLPPSAADGAAAAEPAPANAPAPDPSAGEAWLISLGSLGIEGFRVDVADRSRDPAVATAIDPLTVDITDWSSAPGSRFGLQARAVFEHGGTLSLEGTAVADPVSLDARVQLADLALDLAQPYVTDFVAVEIEKASLSLDGQLTSSDQETLRFEGTVNPGPMEIKGAADGERLAGWESVRSENVVLALDDGMLDVDQVTLAEPFLRVHIDEQGNLNLAQLTAEPGGEEAPPPEKPEAATGEPAGQAFRVNVGRMVLADGSMDFEDLSLPLPFAALIRDMDGEVANISNQSKDAARIQLEGRVNETGSSRIEGTLDLLDVVSQADIAVIFKSVEMPRLTPYTAKFGGYEIDEGRLDLDLRYRLAGGMLDSTNRVVIDQLMLGDKVESPEAINVPLKLAVALLKDSNGTIDLELPVTGDVNDPEFHYGGVVLQVLTGVLVKIVTAPFKLLGSLVGAGDEDLDFVEFPLGEGQLGESGQKRLTTVAGALAQRPALTLVIPASYDPEADGQALRAARLEQELEEHRAGAGDDGGLSALEALYVESQGQAALDALKAEFSKPPADKPDGEPVLDGPGFLEEIRARLIEAQPLTDADLQELGAQRAEAMRTAAIADGTIGDDRVKVAEPAPGGDIRRDRIRIKLELDSS